MKVTTILKGGVAGVLLLAIAVTVIGPLRVAAGARNLVMGRSTIEERVAQYGPTAEPRLRERFERAGLPYPPAGILLVALKEEKELRIFSAVEAGWREAARYSIVAASGGPGPKLREGDHQVPEGFYRIESLNPNSLFHLALRVGYPSDEDRDIAAREGRTRLGGDIMVHGKSASVGCVAIGDAAIEEVFVLAARVGLDNIEVVIAPCSRPKPGADASPWLVDRYTRLGARLKELGMSGE